MHDVKISDSITYIGADDTTLDLFESQYPVPSGVSYNSYLILDKKVAVMDTVDIRATGSWLQKLEAALGGREVDYLVVSHMEPDHAANIQTLALRYPNLKVVGNAKTFTMISQFFNFDLTDRRLEVKEGDSLSLGEHTLQFITAPMVHWPEVMMAYEQSEHILFSADAFGTFGALERGEEWLSEARRYYLNIVGKYGAQVQAVLKKAAGLSVSTICPLHGPVLRENLGFYLGKYDLWSKYLPEDRGVFIAFASIHGNTAAAARKMASLLRERGVDQVVLCDLAREDVSRAVENAFRYDRTLLAAASYDGGVFPCMEEFLLHLKAKNFQKRTVALMENGSWAPSAGKCMRALLDGMKEISLVEPMVTIKSIVKEDTLAQMEALAEKLA